jgi:hypothetical protein
MHSRYHRHRLPSMTAPPHSARRAAEGSGGTLAPYRISTSMYAMVMQMAM